MKPISLLLTFFLTFQLLAQSPATQSDLAARTLAVLAQTSGTLQLAGLQQPVQVLRVQWRSAAAVGRRKILSAAL